ncbi:(Fe-S)-binding protein [Bradymonadaceae bacterium TMQ3]|nr:(Fe-S)-binding protein [Bradymonadaceae bacterium TMQ3]TXC78219.1 (Fe-S)-binding protein [Bradymonadales bacterium TMQ1]
MDSFLELSTGHQWFRVVLGICVLVGFGFAARTVYWLLRYVAAGQGDLKTSQIPERIKGIITQVLGQARVIAEPAGVLHLFIFWGFLILQLETLEYIARAFKWDFHLSAFIGRAGYNGALFMQDVFGFLVLVAILMSAFRRYVIRPKHSLQSVDGAVIIALIASLMITKFIANGAEIAFISVENQAHDAQWTPVALFTSTILQSLGASPQSEGMFWIYHVSYWLHIGIVVAFANYIPFGKHLHLIGAIPNIFFRKLEPSGALYPIDMEDENVESFGAARVEDLRWKQLLDTYACTECGRCEHYCPAYNTGKALNPMAVIHNIKEHLREKGVAAIRGNNPEAAEEFPPLAGGIITKEELWACTTCGACVANCPVYIEHVDTIVDMRRYLALMESDFSAEVGRTFRNMENNSNPWGISSSYRADWAEGLDIPLMSEMTSAPDYLFFVGCAGSFDDRQKKVTQAFAKILRSAGVSVAILGPEEACTGDPARRIGNEYLYWMLATQNIETMNSYGVTKIITTCPHCFHTIGKEYPQLGGHYEVLHHTALLNELIQHQRIQLKPSATMKVTYHDSCYIGRWDNSYSNPREVLQSVPGVVMQEMDLNKKQSFCCGAGGGRMWMEETEGKRVNIERTDQALATTPDAIAVNCPFCLTMFDDGLKNRGADEVKLLDLAEIIAENLVENAPEETIEAAAE